MEFGLGFWILFIVIFVGCGKMCGWGARKYREHHRELEKRRDDEDRLSKLEARVRGLDRGSRDRDGLLRPAMFHREQEKEREPVARREKRPSQLELLQQKFIEGKLSLDEYEREIDRLEKLE
ncbi:MAG: hypothetical protein JSV86_21410 [Gemmatimonadota bacterium]|nr:MAG: hypothetical protein JSV86_21410 [Gemmatimonadota bacterium]